MLPGVALFGTSPHYEIYAVQFVCYISLLYSAVYSLYLLASLHKYKSLLEILLVKYQYLIHVEVWRLQLCTQNKG